MVAAMHPPDVTGRPTRLREVDLDRFFSPSSIVVIGASDTEGAPNTAIWRTLTAHAERVGAAIHPVNPRLTELDGFVCHPSIAEVPGPVDLAVILVRDAVGAFRDVSAHGARFAVIFGAGFAEAGAGGVRLQRRLDQLLAATDTRLLGPNTNLNAFQHFREDLTGPAIALITQSGHQGRPVFQAQDLGVRLSHWAPTGNEADLEFADFARYFADQPTTGAIAAYIEGFKDGRTLMLAADHAAKAGVPIVCVKVGRSPAGSSMARSHTAHLTGSDRITSDVFRQFGIIRVDGLDELTDVSAALARSQTPSTRSARRRNVAVYAISGGTGAHMADLVAAAGMNLPRLSRATRAALRSHIPGYLRVSNPVDSGGRPSVDPTSGPAIIDAIVADPAVDLLIVPITGAVEEFTTPFAEHLVAAAERTDVPIFVVWGSPTTDVAFTDVLCASSRLSTFRTFGNAVTAARAYFDHHEFQSRYRSPFVRPPLRRSPAASKVAQLLRPDTTLTELVSKQVLAAYGIRSTRDILASSPDTAARAARRLKNPVVMKIASPDIAHKSDLGLVAIGIDGERQAMETFEKLVRRARKRAPGAAIEGVLVCEQAKAGIEVTVGVTQDPLFGPTVLFGSGGIFVEVLDDVSTRVAPFDRAEARRMIDQTRGSALLHGVRGHAPASITALVDVIMRVQRLAVDFADVIAEIDINPVAVTPKGATALDALIVCR